jgi:predicted GNAT family acetyltransferase
MNNDSKEVQHQPRQNRFILPIDDALAVLEYERNNDYVDFVHTWVPPEKRGGQHARILVEEGIAWARCHNLKIVASCWYVAKFLQNND